MTTMTSTGMPSMNPPPVRASHHSPDGTKKRLRAKRVTWASPETLTQVRLFEAEDAPSLSGLVLQDLLEAKKTKFMHALVPVSTDDLPPGFEGGATKRARLDSATILAMNAEIAWQSPEGVQYDRSWQVASGNESTEVNVQHQREVKVLEAIYPRPSAIPISPVEPPDAPSDLKDGQILEISLIPTEDEEDALEEDDSLEGMGSSKPVTLDSNSGGYKAASVFPPGYSLPKDAKNLALKSQSQLKSGSSSAAAQLNSDLTSAFLRNADPDVAAAAAAAYAVLKAKESGVLIDHDLLIKILSNPLLIETLTASNPSLRNQLEDSYPKTSSNRGNANGNGIKTRSESSGEGSQSSSLMMQGRQMYNMSNGMPVMQGWGSNPSRFPSSQGRGYPMVGAHEQLSAMKGMLGPARGVYMNGALPGRPYPIPRDLTQQHGMPGITPSEAYLRQSAVPMAFDEGLAGHDPEWYRAAQPWVGVSSSAVPSAALSRSNLPQDRLGGSKIRKQCFFFNTPRGCRNGIHCNFLHEVAPETTVLEKMQQDAGQEAQSNKEETSDAEAK